ncbi:hypothetical protein EW145_g3393 [Phellinidium pouzarii]|uniref:G-patch domain-containing protein n=1 Tax=Phellinidium pouzarii TaxID=167371 RepID=A0A4S4L7I0_9AGAM|nr:hypothetical protein EW145_g3393 [Phellinidium pouzarii]
MPLDGYSYLVAQGWTGKGSGLRQGAISRPLAIPQKRTLAGLGKDRDEAFPFWDHVFAVAAKTIQVKIHEDDDENSNSDVEFTPSPPVLSRSSTGLLSNKRPIVGTPAFFDTLTPVAGASSPSAAPRMSLIAIAKREAARKCLYARFFRGPVLGPDADFEKVASTSTAVARTPAITAITATDIHSGADHLLRKGEGKAKGKDEKVEKPETGTEDEYKETSERKRKHTSIVKDGKDSDKRREKKRSRKANHDCDNNGEEILPKSQVAELRLKKKRRKEQRIKDESIYVAGADTKENFEQDLKSTSNLKSRLKDEKSGEKKEKKRQRR